MIFFTLEKANFYRWYLLSHFFSFLPCIYICILWCKVPLWTMKTKQKKYFKSSVLYEKWTQAFQYEHDSNHDHKYIANKIHPVSKQTSGWTVRLRWNKKNTMELILTQKNWYIYTGVSIWYFLKKANKLWCNTIL